jgi:uncharacterized membrane protein
MKEVIKTILLWLLGIFFVLAGINHFRAPEFYLKIMPPYVPWHSAMVAISGAAELLLGLAVLYPKTRKLAGWGLSRCWWRYFRPTGTCISMPSCSRI